jgi:hypothetical protein
MLMLTDMENELVLAAELFQGPLRTEELRRVLFQAMLPEKPDPRYQPHRPLRIQCDNPRIIPDLRPFLDEIAVQIEFTPPAEDIDLLFAEIETLYQTQMSDIPGLLDIPGVTPRLVEDLFSAAATFYRKAPWERLADDQPLAVNFPNLEKHGYIQLMGNAGLEFGLVLFWNWDDLIRVYQFSEDPLDHLPVSGWRSLSFENLEALPSRDQHALKKYAWNVAGNHAYPYPTVFTPETIERPDRDELLAYTALMRTIPLFLDEVLVMSEEGDFLPAKREWTIGTSDGLVKLEISYPAGDLNQPDPEKNDKPNRSENKA